MDRRTPTMTLQMVELWHRTDTIPRLRGPSLQKWREKDNSSPAPSYEEFADGSVQFYSGVNGRPCRNLCGFEKDLLKEFYLQYHMPVEIPYAPFQLPDAHWQVTGTQFQIPVAQLQEPGAQFEIPSFINLEIWRQKLNSPGLDAWEAFIKSHQTKAQKEERDASIKAWMKLMHDMFWHKERHCRCKGKKKGISSRDPITPKEKFQEMVKEMAFGIKWTILKTKFETLPKNEPFEEALIAAPESEWQDHQDAYIEEPNGSTNKPSKENATAGSPSKQIEAQLRAIEDKKLWKVFKMAEKLIKWPRSTAELHGWQGAKAELRKSIKESGYTEFLKNVSPIGSYVSGSELTEDEIKLLNAQFQLPMSFQPPRTPRRYRRKTKKDAATRAAEAKAAKVCMHSFIKFFLENPLMNKDAEDEYINELLHKTRRRRYAFRRKTDVRPDNSNPGAAQEAFIERILERSSRNKMKAKAHAKDAQAAEDDAINNSPSKKISIHLTIKKPSDEHIKQEGDEEMLDPPVKKHRALAPKTPKKAIPTLGNPADAQNENAENSEEIIAITQTPGKNEPGCVDLVVQPMSDHITEIVDFTIDPILLSASAQETANQTASTTMNSEAAKNPSMNTADGTPSKLLILADLAIDQQSDQKMIAAPFKAPKTPKKRKSRAKKPAAMPTQADSIESPENPKMFANAPVENATNDTHSQQLKLGSMTIEDHKNAEMTVAPAKAPIKTAKRKISAKNTSTATPKKRKTPVKKEAIDGSPSKKLKTTHSEKQMSEVQDFVDMIDPLLR